MKTPPLHTPPLHTPPLHTPPVHAPPPLPEPSAPVKEPLRYRWEIAGVILAACLIPIALLAVFGAARIFIGPQFSVVSNEKSVNEPSAASTVFEATTQHEPKPKAVSNSVNASVQQPDPDIELIVKPGKSATAEESQERPDRQNVPDRPNIETATATDSNLVATDANERTVKREKLASDSNVQPFEVIPAPLSKSTEPPPGVPSQPRKESEKPQQQPEGAHFFGAYASGKRFVYVIDRSGSMLGARWELAKRELLRSVLGLNETQKLSIYFFRLDYAVLADGLPATRNWKDTIVRNLHSVRVDNGRSAYSGTNPLLALRRAVEQKPDAVFLLSDGEFDMHALRQCLWLNRVSKIPIHAVSVNGESASLRQLAIQSGGSYRIARP